MENKKTCLIVGAGISGLLAAQTLKKSGIRVIVLDKGRGLGGRLATRRISNGKVTGIFDYGAQSFTIRSNAFRRVAEPWQKAGVIDIWSHGFHDSTRSFKDTGQPRYKGMDSMQAIAKHLAHDLDARPQSKVERLQRREDKWHLFTEDGRSFAGDSLLLTAPVPQNLELLKQSNISLPNTDLEALRAIEYLPTFTVLALLKSESAVPKPGGLWLDGDPIAWIGDNSKKGVSPDAHAVTVHAGEEFSRINFDRNIETVAQELLNAAQDFLKSDILISQIHRWRYATPVFTYENLYYSHPPLNLYMAGDSFGGKRLESAALSGLRVAQALKAELHM
ncbi:FAD-dependent oxidoreductase [candidate division KSB1 bacterium]|nr:FAD-dependent oxidoreductase [candidate division KSB1 bacterium]RQW07120.1 MAG: FAD-dependent oxidoreductase [candidate division KSB1 bacterium]